MFPECVSDSSQLQTLCCELDFRLSCSDGGLDLTHSAPSEARACFYDCLGRRQGRSRERLGHARVSLSSPSLPHLLFTGRAEIQPYKWGVDASGAG